MPLTGILGSSTDDYDSFSGSRNARWAVLHSSGGLARIDSQTGSTLMQDNANNSLAGRESEHSTGSQRWYRIRPASRRGLHRQR